VTPSKIKSNDTVFPQRTYILEFIIILCAILGMWGGSNYLRNNDTALDLNHKIFPVIGGTFTPTSEDHVARHADDSTKPEIMALRDEILTRYLSIQVIQKGHERQVEKLRGELLQSKMELGFAEMNCAADQSRSSTSSRQQIESLEDSIKTTNTKLRYIQKEREVEMEKLNGKHLMALRLTEENHSEILQENTKSILAEKDREMDDFRSISEEELWRGTEASAKGIESLEDSIETTNTMW